ncbi:MAG: glutathione S-transferase family protein [Pseudomonadota bacterium]
MNALELISFPLCPYVQRVAIVLDEKGVPYTRRSIDLADKPDWFIALSPQGKVPLLRSAEGTLFESAAIVEYLDETFEPRLHPQSPWLRAQHRAWMTYGSSLLDEVGRFYSAVDLVTFQRQRQVLRERFERLEAQLDTGPYFAGTAFTLVDAVFAPLFRYWELFDSLTELDLFAGLPSLSAWRQALSERPSVRAAAPGDYLQRLRRFIAGRDSYLGRHLNA